MALNTTSQKLWYTMFDEAFMSDLGGGFELRMYTHTGLAYASRTIPFSLSIYLTVDLNSNTRTPMTALPALEATITQRFRHQAPTRTPSSPQPTDQYREANSYDPNQHPYRAFSTPIGPLVKITCDAAWQRF
jgi:hypothetical protein